MKKTIAMLVAVMSASMMLYADTELIDGVTWSFTKSGGEATVAGATPCVGEMVMPVTLGGATVTRVDYGAFQYKKEITKMTLPWCIRTIGGEAFQYCSALTAINIPNGVTTIDSYAFRGCSSLAKVDLPDTVTSIGTQAFAYCSNLEALQLSAQLTSIPNYAFHSCFKLKKIEIPANVKTIGDNAFFSCNAAASLSLPAGLTTIGWQAFHQCSSLTLLSIPSGTSSIDESAFVGCSGLKSISVGAGNTCVKVADGCLVSLAGTALSAAPSGNESVTVPEGVVSIPGYMFFVAKSMKHITLPSTLMTIGGDAFRYCTSLEEIEFPASFVSFLGKNTFYYCDAIKRTVFNGAPPSGLNNDYNLSQLNLGTLSYPREYGAEWQKAISLSTFSGYTQSDRPEVEYVSVAVRANDPTILDVTYRVKSSKPTVKVRALAFKDSIRSFANVVRPVAFIEGTGANIGDSITANQEYKLSWRVSTDWQIDLAKVKFEVLVVEDDLLPLELITIPANGANRAMEISWNALSEAQVFDALLWLYADGDSGLMLVDGVLRNNGTQIASGIVISNLNAIRFVFAKMGYSTLEGDTLTYAKGATRLDLSPRGVRQYAYRWIDAQ